MSNPVNGRYGTNEPHQRATLERNLAPTKLFGSGLDIVVMVFVADFRRNYGGAAATAAKD
jgi:hypothetical protein